MWKRTIVTPQHYPNIEIAQSGHDTYRVTIWDQSNGTEQDVAQAKVLSFLFSKIRNAPLDTQTLHQYILDRMADRFLIFRGI